MIQIKDYVHNKIWNLKYDLTFDIIYCFVAHIKIVKGDLAPDPPNVNIKGACKSNDFILEAIAIWN